MLYYCNKPEQMVITKHFLAEKLGLDFDIATFFADRKVPTDNMYWKGRFLYLSHGTGFLFIPMIADIMYKSGVEKSVVIDPVRTARMEESFDIVMNYERKKISFEEYILQMSSVFEPHIVNRGLFDDLILHFKGAPGKHFQLGTQVPALDRADAFLFNYTDLVLDKASLALIIKRWYYLAVAHLMLDDFVDLEDDRAKGEENALIELGDNKSALKKATTMLDHNIEGLRETNPLVAAFFDKIFQKTMQDAPIIALQSK